MRVTSACRGDILKNGPNRVFFSTPFAGCLERKVSSLAIRATSLGNLM